MNLFLSAMSILLFFAMISLSPLIVIYTKEKSLLSSLICLEASLLMLMFLILSKTGNIQMKELFMLLMFLSFGACEGAIGLSLLVAIMRSFGNENMIYMTLAKC